MSKDYTRINFNIFNSNLEILNHYTGNNGAGRSALLNFLVASALSNRAVVEVLDRRYGDEKQDEPTSM